MSDYKVGNIYNSQIYSITNDSGPPYQRANIAKVYHKVAHIPLTVKSHPWVSHCKADLSYVGPSLLRPFAMAGLT